MSVQPQQPPPAHRTPQLHVYQLFEIFQCADRQKLEDRNQRSGLETLRLAGIPIKVSTHDGLMHIKQAVIDERISTTGSLNQTTSAARYNDERLDILHDPVSTRRAYDKFLKMWADHSRFADWR